MSNKLTPVSGNFMRWERVMSLAPIATGKIRNTLASSKVSMEDFASVVQCADLCKLVDGIEVAFTMDEAVAEAIGILDDVENNEVVARKLLEAYRELKVEFNESTTVGDSRLNIFICAWPEDADPDMEKWGYCAVTGDRIITPAGAKFADDIEPFAFVTCV